MGSEENRRKAGCNLDNGPSLEIWLGLGPRGDAKSETDTDFRQYRQEAETSSLTSTLRRVNNEASRIL